MNLFIVGAVFILIIVIEKRKWISAGIVFIIGALWSLFYDPVTQFISSLGVDSFSEAKAGFSFEEAKFWFSTISQALIPKPDMPSLLIILALSVASFYCLRWILFGNSFGRKHYTTIILSIAAIFIVYSVQKIISNSVSVYFDNSESYEITKRNFDNKPPILTKDGASPNLIIYIGESTTVMNMGIYGYPRNTTPNLSRLANEDRNFIQFHNVFSTHTHTSPSLLEAFSLPTDKRDEFLPINRRKRVLVVDVLKSAGIQSCLRSNQGMSGTWNQAATIIFRNAEKNFSVNSLRYGNSEDVVKKPWDDDYFEKQLTLNGESNNNGVSLVTILHSYAGHGPYLDNIPHSFRKPVDNYLSIHGPQILTKSNVQIDIESYDSAIKYIDFAISRTIDYVKRSKKATVMIYFSDHGESVFTGRGHDSSRFIHEMARVPFLMYFNDAAIKENPDIYKKYVRLSKSREIATMAQLPSVILDLMRIRIDPVSQPSIYLKPLIGEKCIHSPIVVREVCDGITFVNLNKDKATIPESHIRRIKDMTDVATIDLVESRNDIKKFRQNSKRIATSLEQKMRNQLINSYMGEGYTDK
ncbi:MAG TPA: phosphoethanolamine transferase [Chlorobaculum sp.]|nr:phosphoethanolamine transferase [Chlorobaculum sp.]